MASPKYRMTRTMDMDGRLAARFLCFCALVIGLAYPACPTENAPAATTNQPTSPAAIATSKPLGALGLMAAMKKVVAPREQQLAEAIKKADWPAAESLCRQLINEAPFFPNGYYNLACVMARKKRQEEAFQFLREAVERGFNNGDHLEKDPDLAGLRDDPRFVSLLTQARAAKGLKPGIEFAPGIPTNGVAWVADANTIPTDRGLFRAVFKADRQGAAHQPITTLKDATGDLLRQWQKEGTAAGLAGDFYDNRDGDHSNLKRELFPQLVFIEYSTEAKDLQLHWGLPEQLVIEGGVVLGNASVAATTSPFWRSMSRAAYTSARPLGLLQLQYFSNQIYLYPCHKDHSPGRDGKLPGGENGGHGDVFPANTPYLITTQGSSGSDQVFLQALAATLAAFRPEVKEFLVEKRALMPCLQMIFRFGNKAVSRPEDYLTGAAHPTVFNGQQIDRLKMAQMAHEIPLLKTPPIVLLKVEEEDKPAPGRDLFFPTPSEELFTTPCAIARVMHSTKCWRRLVVSAKDSRDLNDRALTWHWAVLRGDTNRIRIKPLNAEGSRVEILAAWHPRRPIQPGADLESNRIDVGAFVHNGAYYSAPAFVTWYCPDNEERVYDAQDRPLSITYTGATEKGHYVDPQVVPPRSWRDEYHYDEQGRLTGWTRRRGDKSEDFTPEGRLILSRDAQGRPAETVAVRYVLQRRAANQAPIIEQVMAY